MFLAGFIGSEEKWEAFVPKWKEALGQRKFLHMTDLRWNRDRTRRLLERLGPVPSNCGLEGIMGGVRFQDYEDLVLGKPEEKLLRGYIACLFPMVTQVLRGMPSEEQLEIVFEQQKEYEPFVNMALPFFTVPDLQAPWKFTTDGKPRLAKWRFVPKGSTVRTDPADYLAFALREAWTDKNSKKSKWCKPILASGSGYGRIMQRDEIRLYISSTQLITAYDFLRQPLLDLLRGVQDRIEIRVPTRPRNSQ